MLSNEMSAFLKNIEQIAKTVQSEEDVVKEDVAKVIHEFEESIKNKKVTTKQKLNANVK